MSEKASQAQPKADTTYGNPRHSVGLSDSCPTFPDAGVGLQALRGAKTAREHLNQMGVGDVVSLKLRS